MGLVTFDSNNMQQTVVLEAGKDEVVVVSLRSDGDYEMTAKSSEGKVFYMNSTTISNAEVSSESNEQKQAAEEFTVFLTTTKVDGSVIFKLTNPHEVTNSIILHLKKKERSSRENKAPLWRELTDEAWNGVRTACDIIYNEAIHLGKKVGDEAVHVCGKVAAETEHVNGKIGDEAKHWKNKLRW